jgi:hypothetical protein
MSPQRLGCAFHQYGLICRSNQGRNPKPEMRIVCFWKGYLSISAHAGARCEAMVPLFINTVAFGLIGMHPNVAKAGGLQRQGAGDISSTGTSSGSSTGGESNPVCTAGVSVGEVQRPVWLANLSGQASWFASPVVADLGDD